MRPGLYDLNRVLLTPSKNINKSLLRVEGPTPLPLEGPTPLLYSPNFIYLDLDSDLSHRPPWYFYYFFYFTSLTSAFLVSHTNNDIEPSQSQNKTQ